MFPLVLRELTYRGEFFIVEAHMQGRVHFRGGTVSLLGDQLEARRMELRTAPPVGRVVEQADVVALAITVCRRSRRR
jgi:hypothetical protein